VRKAGLRGRAAGAVLLGLTISAAAVVYAGAAVATASSHSTATARSTSTATPKSTSTPRPTHTPTPKPTPKPTHTPTPTPTPVPVPTPTPQPPPNSSITYYDPTPGDTTDGTYTLTADGAPVAVTRSYDVAYARFAFSGSVNLVVTAPQTVTTWTISPLADAIQATPSGSSLSFTLGNPATLIVTVNSLEKLFIFADPLESNPPVLGGPGVVNLALYATDNTGTTLQTKQIQAAIDATAAQGGGTGGVIYVADGVYLVGTLHLRSNVAMYLQSGALLQGSPHSSDYSSSRLIATDGAGNVKLFGRGVIDGHGTTLRSSDKVRIVEPAGGQNVEVDDVLLRDSASWTVHIDGVSHATITNVKVVNNMALGADDGIDPDGSTNVLVNGAFVHTFDDCFAVKSSGSTPTDQVLIENSVCDTQKSALKIGTETGHDISNVTFSGNNVVHADRAMSVYMVDGGNLSNLSYVNDTSETIGGNAKQQLIDFEVSNGQASNVSVTDYTAYSYSPNSSLTQASAGHTLPVTFNHLVIAGTTCVDVTCAHIVNNGATLVFTP
jgi:Glycosyl hydrolases family 28